MSFSGHGGCTCQFNTSIAQGSTNRPPRGSPYSSLTPSDIFLMTRVSGPSQNGDSFFFSLVPCHRSLKGQGGSCSLQFKGLLLCHPFRNKDLEPMTPELRDGKHKVCKWVTGSDGQQGHFNFQPLVPRAMQSWPHTGYLI